MQLPLQHDFQGVPLLLTYILASIASTTAWNLGKCWRATWAVVSEAALWTAADIACDSWQLASSRRSANTPASPLGTRQRLFHDQKYPFVSVLCLVCPS